MMRNDAQVHKQTNPIQWDSAEQRKDPESWCSEQHLCGLMPQHSTAETHFLKRIPDSHKIFLNNIDKQASYIEVFDLLRPFGVLLRLNLPMSKKTKRNRGYGYAIFERRGSVTRLMELNGSIGIGDRILIFERFKCRKKETSWGDPEFEQTHAQGPDFRPSDSERLVGGFGKKTFKYEEEGEYQSEHLQQPSGPLRFRDNQSQQGLMEAGDSHMVVLGIDFFKPTQKAYFVTKEARDFRKHQLNTENYRIRRSPTKSRKRL